MRRWVGPGAVAGIALAALLAACGGGGGSSPPPAPTKLSYPVNTTSSVPLYLYTGFPMSSLTPTVTGQVTSWTVSPALPAGITLNAGTGVISGTATASGNVASYTITASNAGGMTSTTLTIQVIAVSIVYFPGGSGGAIPSSSFVFAPGVPVQPLGPAVINRPVNLTQWSVTPALPAGLNLDPTTGVIWGLPTAPAAAASYTITGLAGAQGQISTALTISVAGTRLVDLGLANQLSLIRYANSSVLSRDNTGVWVLQDFASGTILAEGGVFPEPFGGSFLDYNTYVDLENGVMVDEAASALALEVRSATTGQVLGTIPIPATSCNYNTGCGAVPWYRLATDGSYVVLGTQTALTAWSTSGQTLLSIAGNYAQTENLVGATPTGLQPFAAPGQIQIASGPAGANVIQTVTVPGGLSSVSPTFQGTFGGWFIDGGRFLSTQGSTAFTYSAAGVQQDTTALTGPVSGLAALGGLGNWLWTLTAYPNALNVYKVGASGSPALTMANAGNVMPSGSTLGLSYGTSLTVLDLSGSTPVSTSYSNVPFAPLFAYAAQSATQWLAGNGNGVVLDGTSVSGTPRSLTLGTALSVAAGTSYISVATASGKVLLFNSSDDTAAGSIAFSASELAASSDGTVLAAVTDWQSLQSSNQAMQTTDSTLNVYSLPSATLSTSFPYAFPGTALTTVALSGSGTVVAETFNSPTTACLIQVIAVAGGAPIVCDNTSGDVSVHLSPDGTLATTSPAGTVNMSTRIYNNGTLVTAVPGYAFGWLDNSHLLVDNYTVEGNDNNLLLGTGLTIYDAAGNQVGTSPVLTTDQILIAPGATSLYDVDVNSIVSLSSGATTWACGSASSILPSFIGFVAGGAGEQTYPSGVAAGLTASQVVFASNNVVMAVPY
jgi:hypothetical protein